MYLLDALLASRRHLGSVSLLLLAELEQSVDQIDEWREAHELVIELECVEPMLFLLVHVLELEIELLLSFLELVFTFYVGFKFQIFVDIIKRHRLEHFLLGLPHFPELFLSLFSSQDDIRRTTVITLHCMVYLLVNSVRCFVRTLFAARERVVTI